MELDPKIPKVYFMHRRPLEEDKSKALRGGVTAFFAFYYNEKTRESEVQYAVARCSFLDNFSRPRSREIATGKFAKGKKRRFTLEPMTLKEARWEAHSRVKAECDRQLDEERRWYESLCQARLEVQEAFKVLRFVQKVGRERRQQYEEVAG